MMDDIYLTGEPEKQKRGWWTSRSELILLLVLGCLTAYAYMRFDARLAALEQVRSAPEKGKSNRCEWGLWVRARDEGSQTCPAGSYVQGVGVSYDDGFRQSYPLQYRLYCCAFGREEEEANS